MVETMIVDEVTLSSSFSSHGGISSPPTEQAGVPLHENAGPQYPLSSSATSDQAFGRKRRKKVGGARVVVRIRPLTSNEKSLGEKPCIHPILARANPSTDQLLPPVGGKKHMLSQRNREPSPPVSVKLLSPRVVLSPSRTSPRPCPRNKTQKKFNFDFEECSSETIATSLISGTENKMRFDFDQVLGPSMSQEQCYERAVGDVVRKNVSKGMNTTIIAVGHRKSGKSYTMSGGWKARRLSGEKANAEHGLTELAGILPRAVHDLFNACTVHSEATISMSFCMIACEGGRTRDLLSRFRNKPKETIQGLSYIQVNSPQEAKRLMDRASIKRVPDIKEGRNFHLFCSFRAVCAREGPSIKSGVIDSKREVSTSRLTLVKLTTPSNPKMTFATKAEDRSYNLRELLQAMSSSVYETSDNYSARPGLANLNRRFDDALQGVMSTIIVGCVSPVESEMEHSMDVLRLVAMATKATYIKESSDSSLDINSAESDSAKSNISITDSSSTDDAGGSALSSLQKTLKQAERTAKNAQETSTSLDAAAKRWRSHRHKLSRESTVAALAQMTKLTGQKARRKSTSVGYKVGQERERKRRPGRDFGPSMTRQIERNARQGQRHGPELLRENEVLKSQVGKLMKESRSQKHEIMSLKQKMAEVKKRLVEERNITSKLEDIRNILKRKALLQRERIQMLEKKMDSASKTNGTPERTLEERGFVMPDGQHEMNIRVKEMQQDTEGRHTSLLQDLKYDQAPDFQQVETLVYPPVDDSLGTLSTYNMVLDTGDTEGKLLSVLKDSGAEASTYLAGDEAGSVASISSTKNPIVPTDESSDKHRFEKPANENVETVQEATESCPEGPISNINVLDKFASCPCQSALLSGGHSYKIEFYLPSLSVSCLCGKQQSLLFQHEDVKRISSILRPWQAEFLASMGIFEIEEFFEVYKNDEKKLSKRMVEWRARRGQEVMSRKACTVALLIWSRTCSLVKQAGGKRTNLLEKTPDFLDLSSMDSSRVSSIGLESSAVDSEGH